MIECDQEPEFPFIKGYQTVKPHTQVNTNLILKECLNTTHKE